MSVKLFWNKICPFVQRAWIVAVEKNIPVELVYVPLDQDTPEWYAKINPNGTVPTLQHGDRIVFESNLIAQYLDDTFEPKQSLFPGSAFDRHRIRFFLEQVGEFVGYAYGFLMDSKGEGKQADFEWNVNNLEKLLVEQSSGPFFLGDTFSLADIALIPFLDRFRHTLYAYANGYDLFASAPRLKRLLDAAQLRPSVFKTSQPASVYINAYKGYVSNGPIEPTPHPMKLYSSARCPFCEKVRIAAALKRVPVEIVEIDLENLPAWYEKDVNPRGTVPALALEDGKVVQESNLIAAYFDEEFLSSETPTLVPTDGVARYQQNFFLEKVSNLVGAIYGFLYHNGADEKRVSLQEAAKVVEELLEKQSAGPFFFGAEVSLADLALIPNLVRLGASLADFGNGYTSFFADYPRLGALDKAVRDHPIIGQVLQEPEVYLGFMRERVAAHNKKE